ncbi:MAG: dTDP-4-dehydrorhamnose reductase [Tepidisphaeraceae bacterium]|jgi:dTDP-4-dehydrorhamnose reductase
MAENNTMPAQLHPLLSPPPTLLGAGGMLFRAWAELLQRRSIHYRSLSIDDFDLARPATIGPALGSNPGVVINCAAYTNVDGAERDEPLATAINGTGVGALAEECRKRGSLLVHYSTDYAFDGRAGSPYPVDAPRRPINAYARSKVLGEELIEKSGCEYLLIRTSWLYAPWGNNFVRTIAGLVRKGQALKVVADQRGRPTSAESLARVSLKLLEAAARGIFHVTDAGECSWHEFACEIARHVNPSATVAPCTTAEFPRPAPRPAYTVMDISRTESLVGPLPHWTDSLAAVMPRLEGM